MFKESYSNIFVPLNMFYLHFSRCWGDVGYSRYALRLRINYRSGAQFYAEKKWEARKFCAPGQAQARKVRAARACAPKNDRPVDRRQKCSKRIFEKILNLL